MIKRIVAVAGCFLILSVPARAQIERPVAEITVSGRVSTVTGSPVIGAAITIVGSKSATRSDSAGGFRLARVPKDVITIEFHRLGYVPAMVTLDATSGTDTLFVQMLANTPTVDTFKVTAQTNLLAGIVLDAQNQPVSGALVTLVGRKSLEIESGADGWFTFSVERPGPIVFRVKKPGFASLTESLRLDGVRGVVLHLLKPSANLTRIQKSDADGYNNRMVFVWHQTDHRMAVKSSRAAIVPREELAPLGAMPLGNAVRFTKSGRGAANFLTNQNNEVCVLLDGYRPMGLTSLDIYRASDVEFVELYPPGSEMSGSLDGYLNMALCSDPFKKRDLRPYYAVIWMRLQN